MQSGTSFSPADHRAARTPSVTARATVNDRVLAVLGACGLLAVLITAAALRPNAAGIGTHQQLGLPPCGWIASMGTPCPTCGMTTAFADAASAHPWDALRAQPMGALLALLAAAGFWACIHVACFGSRLGTVLVRALRPRLLWVIAALWAASWVYKVLVFRSGL